MYPRRHVLPFQRGCAGYVTCTSRGGRFGSSDRSSFCCAVHLHLKDDRAVVCAIHPAYASNVLYSLSAWQLRTAHGPAHAENDCRQWSTVFPRYSGSSAAFPNPDVPMLVPLHQGKCRLCAPPDGDVFPDAAPPDTCPLTTEAHHQEKSIPVTAAHWDSYSLRNFIALPSLPKYRRVVRLHIHLDIIFALIQRHCKKHPVFLCRNTAGSKALF